MLVSVAVYNVYNMMLLTKLKHLIYFVVVSTAPLPLFHNTAGGKNKNEQYNSPLYCWSFSLPVQEVKWMRYEEILCHTTNSFVIYSMRLRRDKHVAN
jgi:hypothetical protein